MVTKNEGGGEKHSNSGSVRHYGDRGLFAIGTCRFSVKPIISVSGCYSFIYRQCLEQIGEAQPIFSELHLFYILARTYSYLELAWRIKFAG